MRNNMSSQLGKKEVYQTKLLAQLNILNSSSKHFFLPNLKMYIGKCIVLKQPYFIVYSLLSQKKRKKILNDTLNTATF